jgi:hypothetical protein
MKAIGKERRSGSAFVESEISSGRSDKENTSRGARQERRRGKHTERSEGRPQETSKLNYIYKWMHGTFCF